MDLVSCSMWDLPGSGIQSMSPALADGLRSTGPLRKCLWPVLFLFFFLQLSQHSFILSGVIRSCPPLFPSSSIGHLVTWSGGLIFQCYIFLLFYTVQAKLTAKILEWLATPSPGGSHSVTALRYDTSFLGGPTRNGSQLY